MSPTLTTPVCATHETATCPVEEAQGYFEEGVRALNERRYADAALSLQRSLCRPVPVVRYDIALAYRGMGRYRAAIEQFGCYLAHPDPDATEDRLRAIHSEVDNLRQQVVEIVVPSVDPPATTLRVDDGPPTFSDEHTLQLDPGPHVLTWTALDHVPSRWEEVFNPGGRFRHAVSLVWRREGRLVVEPSVETAVVSLDGQRVGVGHVESAALSPGTHDVDIRADGYLPFHRTVEISHTGVVRVDAALSHRGLPGWVLPVSVAAGVVVTAAAIGGILAATTGGPRGLYPANWSRVTEPEGP